MKNLDGKRIQTTCTDQILQLLILFERQATLLTNPTVSERRLCQRQMSELCSYIISQPVDKPEVELTSF